MQALDHTYANIPGLQAFATFKILIMCKDRKPVKTVTRGDHGHIEPLHNAAGMSGAALKISRADE